MAISAAERVRKYRTSDKGKTKIAAWVKANKERLNRLTREWRRANPEREKSNARNRLYGLSVQHYSDLVVKQNNRCAICGTDTPGGGNSSWNVDHNHATGHVRGLLCRNCNIGLGHFKDDALRLEIAANYIRKNT